MGHGKLNYLYIINNLYNPLSFDSIDLLQIGLAHCDRNTTVAEHTHTNYYELSIIALGSGTITTNGIVSSVERDDVYLSLPNERHRLDSNVDSRMNYYFFAFKINDANLDKQMKKTAKSLQNERKRIFKNDVLKQLVASAIAELDSNGPYKNKYLDCLFTQIIIQILRSNKKQTTNLQPNAKNETCYQVMSYIRTHIYTLTALTDLSSVMSYDYNYLSKMFVAVTGQTISDYYREQRLEAARMLIRENNLNFTQIAEKLHYSSIYSFSKAFKQQYGISPKEYQKTIK